MGDHVGAVDPGRRDERTAIDWYRGTGPAKRRRRRPPWLVVAIAVAVALGVIYAGGRMVGLDPTASSRNTVNSLLNDVPTLAPLPPTASSPTPASAGPSTPTGGADPTAEGFRARYHAIAGAHPDVAEGADYSFMEKVDGAPLHWSCATTIPVVLAGQVPAGADSAFTEVVDTIRSRSGLPLSANRDAGQAAPGSHQITVFYGRLHDQPGTIRIDEAGVLGMGGPRWGADAPAGFVSSGEVLVRSDVAGFEPSTAPGKHVLAHEIMHALGLRHSAADRPEVMAPSASRQETWPDLGAGDRVALEIVGCGQG